MKVCAKCRIPKPLSEFFRQSSSIDGRNYYCKSCNAAWARANRPHSSPNRGDKRLRGKECKLHPECAKIERDEVYRRGQGICGICGHKLRRRWHMDHIIPLSKKGRHCYYNLQPSHVRCNLRKGNKT